MLFRTGVQGRMLNILNQCTRKSKQACVRNNTPFTRYFGCSQGLKQGCLANPIFFSVLINELANDIIAKGTHGATSTHDEIELFLLLFADVLKLLSSSIIGLQTQINNLQASVQRLKLTVNLEK